MPMLNDDALNEEIKNGEQERYQSSSDGSGEESDRQNEPEEALIEEIQGEEDEVSDEDYPEVGEEGPVRFSDPTDRSPIEKKIQIPLTRCLMQKRSK